MTHTLAGACGMTRREELTQLAERVKALTGPDRETDVMIALAVGWDLPDSSGFGSFASLADKFGMEWAVGTSQAYDSAYRCLPRYTASLDAAKSLVPEGMRRRSVVMEDGRAAVQLWWPTDDMPTNTGTLRESEPIATVEAALLALAEQET